MKEIKGNLWDYLSKENHICCITTNGFVKKNDEAVMGRGCAKEAADMNPVLSLRLGKMIKEHGNHVFNIPVTLAGIRTTIMTFPVKHKWYEKADLELIKKSAKQLNNMALAEPMTTFILPRPGCGNGKLYWQTDVKPLLEFLPDNVLVISKLDE